MRRKMERRSFIKYLGGGVVGSAFTNLLSVRKKSVEYLYSYVQPPEGVIPGVADWYATVCRQCPAGCGIQVKIREGRAKKVEGNPDFPVNYGRVCARGQAGLQTLYNPDRITGPMIKTEDGFEKISWNAALKKLADNIKETRKDNKKDNIAFITDPVRGNLSGLVSTFLGELGSHEVYAHGLFNDEAVAAANERCFGIDTVPDYDIENTRFILSLGTGFLDTWASPVKHAVGYGRMRDRNEGHEGERGWLVQFESRVSVTGNSADEWHAINPGTEGLLAMGIARVIVETESYDHSIESEIKGWKKALAPYDAKTVAKQTGVSKETIIKTAKEFTDNKPAIAMCGGGAAAQANGGFNALAANVLNHLVGSIGHEGGVQFPTPSFFSSKIEKSLPYKHLTDLADRMSKRELDIVFINNTNPVFTLPDSAGLKKGLEETPVVVSFSNFMDETTVLADLILPDSHYLESWGDYIPMVDTGHKTLGLMQPVVMPFHDTRQIGDVILSLAKLVGGSAADALPQESFEEYLKNEWRALYIEGRDRKLISEPTFEKFWDVALKNGGWWEEESAHAKLTKEMKPNVLADVHHKSGTDEGGRDFHLELYPSHTAYDGRGANQPWLQQLPAPLVTAAWGTWAEINPKTAEELDVNEGDVLELRSSVGTIEVPVYIYPGIHPKSIAVPIGQGHTDFGQFADGYGVNPLVLVDEVDELSGGLAWASVKVSVKKTNKSEKIVKTDPISNQPGLDNGPREMDRHLVQWLNPEAAEEIAGHELKDQVVALPTRDLRKAPHFLSSIGLAKYRTSQFHDYEYRWGMVIDLDKCNGCGACTVSCYAENNLPLINAQEMGRGRNMNWMRIDRYWDGDFPEIRTKTIPMNCFQCGNAPCEPVCPVYAAYHTVDGLNGQVYPRCIGTRYCNAGCPYKARRFNWQKSEWPEPLNHQLNTDVTVRFAGVTEKCTFCVQRIRAAKDTAKDESRKVRDGEITPACAQTCPSGAITFGDLHDPDSNVSQMTKNPRRYRVLEELNTEPAVVYLKAVRVGGASADEDGHGGGEEEEHGDADEGDHDSGATEDHGSAKDEGHAVEEEGLGSDEH